jgi:dihydroneopterin aldolase
MRLEAI